MKCFQKTLNLPEIIVERFRGFVPKSFIKQQNSKINTTKKRLVYKLAGLKPHGIMMGKNYNIIIWAKNEDIAFAKARSLNRFKKL